MLEFPEKVQTAALELFEKARVKLNIPNRSEILELAEQLSAMSDKLAKLQAERNLDSGLVAELRQELETVKQAKAGVVTTETAEPVKAKAKKKQPAPQKAAAKETKPVRKKKKKTDVN